VDAAGNVLVSGTFQFTTDLGGGPITPTTSSGNPLTGEGRAMFVGKLSGTDGSHLWSKGFGPLEDDFSVSVQGRRIAVDGSGNVLATGRLAHCSTDLGGGPIGSSARASIILAKFSGANGSHLWSKAFLGWDAPGSTPAVDQAGNVLLVGSFGGTADFGGGPLTAESPWNTDIFVAKVSGADGSHLWSKAFGGSGNCYGRHGAVDAYGNVLVTGDFWGTVDFGGGPLTTLPEGLSQCDIFVAKLSGADGSHFWSKAIGNTSADGGGGGASVASDAGGNVFVTGWFAGTVDFGGGPLTSIPSQDGEPSGDIFVLKLHP